MRNVFRYLVTRWLTFWAQLQLRKLNAKVVAVAGSSGKTSTASALVAALTPYMRVRSGVGLNTDTGVPLGILGITMEHFDAQHWLRAVLLAPWRVATDWKKCDVYVAEYGIDHPGDMKQLLRICVPYVAVLTGVGLEHAGYFTGSLQEVLLALADEEVSLLEALPHSGLAIASVRDAAIADRLPRLKAKVKTVGRHAHEDYEVEERYTLTPTTTDWTLFHRGVSYPVHLPFPVTEASMESMALAAAAAHELDVPLKDALAEISRVWQIPAGRGRVLDGKKHMLLIDSTYNATPFAVADALRFVSQLGAGKRRVAILGDMRELGEHAAASHADLAETVAASVDLALLVGPEMKAALAPALEGKVAYQVFDTVKALLAQIDALLVEGDVVLLKGSQNTLYLERVTEYLLARPGDAELLPRRGARWDAIRAAAE